LVHFILAKIKKIKFKVVVGRDVEQIECSERNYSSITRSILQGKFNIVFLDLRRFPSLQQKLANHIGKQSDHNRLDRKIIRNIILITFTNKR